MPEFSHKPYLDREIYSDGKEPWRKLPDLIASIRLATVGLPACDRQSDKQTDMQNCHGYSIIYS